MSETPSQSGGVRFRTVGMPRRRLVPLEQQVSAAPELPAVTSQTTGTARRVFLLGSLGTAAVAIGYAASCGLHRFVNSQDGVYDELPDIPMDEPRHKTARARIASNGDVYIVRGCDGDRGNPNRIYDLQLRKLAPSVISDISDVPELQRLTTPVRDVSDDDLFALLKALSGHRNFEHFSIYSHLQDPATTLKRLHECSPRVKFYNQQSGHWPYVPVDRPQTITRMLAS